VQLTVIWVAAALTIATGIQYLVDGRRAQEEAGTR
jgi:phosphatidylglycerophosphate synthase